MSFSPKRARTGHFACSRAGLGSSGEKIAEPRGVEGQRPRLGGVLNIRIRISDRLPLLGGHLVQSFADLIGEQRGDLLFPFRGAHELVDPFLFGDRLGDLRSAGPVGLAIRLICSKRTSAPLPPCRP